MCVLRSLRCVVLCYDVVCCALLSYVVLRCVMLPCVLLRVVIVAIGAVDLC